MQPSESQLWKHTLQTIDVSFKNKKPDSHFLATNEIRRLRAFLGGRRSEEAKEKIEQIVNLLNKHKKKILTAVDSEGPTVQTLLRRTKDSIESLEYSGALSPEQAGAAIEIRQVFEEAVSALTPKGARLLKMDRGATTVADRSIMLAEWFFERYAVWCSKMMKSSRSYKLARRVILDGICLDSARKEISAGYDTGAKMLRSALDAYIAIRSRGEGAFQERRQQIQE